MRFSLILIVLGLFVAFNASAIEWLDLSGNESNSPRPGETLIYTVATATETTGLIHWGLCSNDSSFSIASDDNASGAVETCKKSAGTDDSAGTDCETDASAGVVTAANYAYIRQGLHGRLSITGGTAGDRFFFHCNTPGN